MLTQAAKNVLKVYQRASEGDMVAGKLWYRTARETCFNLASQYKVLDREGKPDFVKVAGIVAALSPQQGWKVNLAQAAQCLKTKKFRSHTRANCEKARRIFKGEEPLKVLGGHKVRAFFRNIVAGGETGLLGGVCVDRHTLSVCLGRETTPEDQQHLSNRVSLQRECQNAFKLASIKAGLLPSELQAITWITYRREKGITD